MQIAHKCTKARKGISGCFKKKIFVLYSALPLPNHDKYVSKNGIQWQCFASFCILYCAIFLNTLYLPIVTCNSHYERSTYPIQAYHKHLSTFSLKRLFLTHCLTTNCLSELCQSVHLLVCLSACLTAISLDILSISWPFGAIPIHPPPHQSIYYFYPSTPSIPLTSLSNGNSHLKSM